MNPKLHQLHSYPFQKLNQLISTITPKRADTIKLTIGEPQHQPPEFVIDTLKAHLDKLAYYPKTMGNYALRKAIAEWANQRFSLDKTTLDPEQHILPVNGTREALFAFIQAAIDPALQAKVLLPNPFYQIYEGAAMLAGAEPYYIADTASHSIDEQIENLPASVLNDCQLLMLCNPANPTGRTISMAAYRRLIELADQYDFIVASDECYSEIYTQTAPLGLLEVCNLIGRDDFHRCVVFNSLSKRSNLPGLRSGFVAGDKDLIKAFLQYRTYHGCAMSETTQYASIAAWQDEEHVITNRRAYQQRFAKVTPILQQSLPVETPAGGFFLWLPLPDDDVKLCQALYHQQNVLLLPGQFLSREVDGVNPGKQYARMALVCSDERCIEAANRINSFFN